MKKGEKKKIKSWGEEMRLPFMLDSAAPEKAGLIWS